MVSTTSRPLARAKRTRAPGMFRRLRTIVWTNARAPITNLLRARRLARLRRSGVDKPHRWRSRFTSRLYLLLACSLAVLFLLWLARAVVVFVWGPQADPLQLDSACRPMGVSCGAVIGFGTTVSSVALAAVAFWLWRFTRVRRWYQRRARKHARDLVATGGLIGNVVGRDEICHVLMEDLRDRHDSRPHVLVGGVGTGKTAVLVRLTQLLAAWGAVPVPIQLRGTNDQLDFAELARKRFLEEIDQRLVSGAQGERIWRQLRRDGRIVVLADGLEEAIAGGGAEVERDNMLRLAIRRAHNERLPLFITSRPHEPLRGMDATIAELESLSEEAALTYLNGFASSQDERRLDWIIETAGVAEAPLYLQITRQLYRIRRLHHLAHGQRGMLDTRSRDRSTLRLWLLRTWEDALVQGYLHGEVPLTTAERRAAVDRLSVLACIGLWRDRLDVNFTGKKGDEVREPILNILASADTGIDFKLAATWGAQLGLVQVRGNGVRFPHSIMEAYLGSRLIGSLISDAALLKRALEKPGPGREFLVALVLHSRTIVRNHRPTANITLTGQEACSEDIENLRDALVEHASDRDDNKALDLFAAALEIDSVTDHPNQTHIADLICQHWSEIRADARTLEEGKEQLVHRFGEALRLLDERRQPGEETPQSAYVQLFQTSCRESSYPIRLSIAQEIGSGGAPAYKAVQSELISPHERADDDDSRPNWRAHWRARLTSAWLAPLLVGSVGVGENRDVRETPVVRDLEQWLSRVQSRGSEGGGLPLSEEIALAQGFKYAANRRRRHPHASPDARVYLAEQALQMLKSVRYWFSQLTLIQALCLWSLREDEDEPAPGHGSQPRALVEYWLDSAGTRANPTSRENRKYGGAPLHPFVAAAAELAVLALETRQPERFCWIDESGVVSRVGSRLLESSRSIRKHHLWIPPSVGWSALEPRAQQLVADVLLLLNLAERGEKPTELQQRQERANRSDLPPCLTRDRTPLDPARTIGMAYTSAPGTNCVDGCPFELCPYPPKGAQRVELSGAFCRRQQTLVSTRRFRRRTSSWQGIGQRRMRQFWTEMADRAQGTRPKPDVD